MNARQAATRLQVSYATVRTWIKLGQLRATKESGEWVVPDTEVERVLADSADYERRHASRILAVELLVERAGTQHGMTMRTAANVARELVKLAKDWSRRARGGASHKATAELAEGVRNRIALIAGLEQRLQLLDQVVAIAFDLLPKDPRRALIELSIRVGGLEPAEAQRVVAGLSDEQVCDRLQGLPDVLAGATTNEDMTKEPV